jgi:hypothetical protein
VSHGLLACGFDSHTSTISARVVELVYTADLKSAALWIGGSNPLSRTSSME